MIIITLDERVAVRITGMALREVRRNFSDPLMRYRVEGDIAALTAVLAALDISDTKRNALIHLVKMETEQPLRLVRR